MIKRHPVKNTTTLFHRMGAEKGFNLIELSVILVILGMVISIAASLSKNRGTYANYDNIKECKTHFERIDRAIKGYAYNNYRLPWADANGDGQEDALATLGNLPWQTLGLESGNDIWSNPIHYGVHADLANPSIATIPFSRDDLKSQAGIEATFPNDTLRIYINATPLTTCAYIIVSGGPTDANNNYGINLKFDGDNEFTAWPPPDPPADPTNRRFEDSNLEHSATYDDIMKVCTVVDFNTVVSAWPN